MLRSSYIGAFAPTFLVLVACGGSAPPPPPAAPALLLPLSEMRYVAGPEVVVVVRNDGSVERPGHPSANIDDGALRCHDGFEILRVDAQSRVWVDGNAIAHVTGDGGFVMDRPYGDWSMLVRDDGTISLTTKREGTTNMQDARWEGYHKNARRTASVLSALFTPTFGGRWCSAHH